MNQMKTNCLEIQTMAPIPAQSKPLNMLKLQRINHYQNQTNHSMLMTNLRWPSSSPQLPSTPALSPATSASRAAVPSSMSAGRWPPVSSQQKPYSGAQTDIYLMWKHSYVKGRRWWLVTNRIFHFCSTLFALLLCSNFVKVNWSNFSPKTYCCWKKGHFPTHPWCSCLLIYIKCVLMIPCICPGDFYFNKSPIILWFAP